MCNCLMLVLWLLVVLATNFLYNRSTTTLGNALAVGKYLNISHLPFDIAYLPNPCSE